MYDSALNRQKSLCNRDSRFGTEAPGHRDYRFGPRRELNIIQVQVSEPKLRHFKSRNQTNWNGNVAKAEFCFNIPFFAKKTPSFLAGTGIETQSLSGWIHTFFSTWSLKFACIYFLPQQQTVKYCCCVWDENLAIYRQYLKSTGE